MPKARNDYEVQVFQPWVIDWLEARTALIFRIAAGLYQRVGWPDLYVSHRRWRGFLELKCDKHKLEDHQRRVLEQLRDRDDAAFVLRGFKDSQELRVEDHYGGMLFQVTRQVDASTFLDMLSETS